MFGLLSLSASSHLSCLLFLRGSLARRRRWGEDKSRGGCFYHSSLYSDVPCALRALFRSFSRRRLIHPRREVFIFSLFDSSFESHHHYLVLFLLTYLSTCLSPSALCSFLSLPFLVVEMFSVVGLFKRGREMERKKWKKRDRQTVFEGIQSKRQAGRQLAKHPPW